MNSKISSTGKDVREYCARIGANPLLVQGAGGNISWKEDHTLWIKASGTCLSNAKKEEIFIPVNFAALAHEITKKNFSAAPKVLSEVKSKPSIETLLHALLPHKIVLHLHAVEILAHLVKQDFKKYLKNIIKEDISFSVINYYKPGADLALAIDAALKKRSSTDVIFLKNHGIVIGGESINDIHKKLSQIIDAFDAETSFEYTNIDIEPITPQYFSGVYTPINDSLIHQLALQPKLFKRLKSDWALYPDHVVFLGPKAYAYESWSKLKNDISNSELSPELIFIAGSGVYIKKSFTKAKQEQLRCYYDILVRQRPDSLLNVLSSDQIAELLNWDAEKYRMNLTSSTPIRP